MEKSFNQTSKNKNKNKTEVELNILKCPEKKNLFLWFT